MGTIPAVPVFPAGQVVTSAALNELGTAMTWCLTGRPLARLEQASAQSIPASTLTAVTWDTAVVDRDSGHSGTHPTRYTSQTPGIYLAAVSLVYTGAGTGIRQAMFRVTTGSSNPGGAGNTTIFGVVSLPNAATVSAAATTQMLSPYLYAGDYLEVLAYQTTSGALSLQTAGASQGPPWLTISLASG